MLHHNYHRDDEKIPSGEAAIIRGYDIIRDFPIFDRLDGEIYMREKSIISGGVCAVDEKVRVYVNASSRLDDSEWANGSTATFRPWRSTAAMPAPAVGSHPRLIFLVRDIPCRSRIYMTGLLQ